MLLELRQYPISEYGEMEWVSEIAWLLLVAVASSALGQSASIPPPSASSTPFILRTEHSPVDAGNGSEKRTGQVADEANSADAAGPNDLQQARPFATFAAPAEIATMIGLPYPSWSESSEWAGVSWTFGNRGNTYISMVFSLLTKHMRLNDLLRAELERNRGEIVFLLDSHGQILTASVTRSTGSSAVDAAMLDDLRAAGPFPPPPTGRPVELKWVYGGKGGF